MILEVIIIPVILVVIIAIEFYYSRSRKWGENE